ncbi:lysin B [Mycobacterium phage Weirdo19]|uniref:Lysin B n=1 Tax=Mycobacterium phage Weirdo19 TaxID=2601610 RepID=A0A6M2YSL8_9CAUD|nr:lysin B [Mycobacterium phage Weirdo19]QEA10795.1 lysin B [Mycobacterium phage Weirdo19]
MAWAPPSQVGDRDPGIPAAKAALGRYSYGKGLGVTDEYTAELGAALRQFQTIVHREVLAGKRQPPDVNTAGVLDWATKVQLGVVARVAPPAPPVRKRFPFYVFRGTGGVIGQDLVSLVCQGAADLVEEINPPWSATMGGIPVGVAGHIGDPSMWAGTQAAVAATQADFLARRRLDPTIKVGVGGYSAGAVVAAIIRQWLLDQFPENYLCSFSLGDPTRPPGGGFYGQPAPWGRGIGSVLYGDPRDYRHCWLTHEGDMYAQIPGGVVGDIMDDVYDEVTRFAFREIPAATLRIVSMIPTVAAKAGIALPAVFGALAGGPAGLATFALPLLIQSLGGFVGPHHNAAELTGTAAAAKAATIALTFLFQGTAPHIRYHLDPAWPGGPTFVQLATQHVRDYAQRVLVAA